MAVPETHLAAVDGRPSDDTSSARPVTAVDGPGSSPRAQLGDWLALVCRMIPDVAAAYAGFADGAAEEFSDEVSWPSDAPPSAELRASARRAILRDEGMVHDRLSDGAEVLARRLKLGPGRHGAIAISVPALSESAHAAIAQLLDWSAVWLDFVSAGAHDDGNAEVARQLVFEGLDAADLRRAATRMAATVATALAAERVSIGLLDREHVELLALSHSAGFNPRLQVNREIVAAMEEALDESRPIVYPPVPDAPLTATHAHERLCAGEMSGSACTLPLSHGDEVIGAVTVECVGKDAFSADTRALLADIAPALGRVLAVRVALERSLLRRAGDALGARAAWLRKPGDGLIKALLLIGFIALATAFIGTGTLQVAAPAVLEGRIQRTLTAPIDGYVAAAPARAGDALKAGDIVAVIDTQSLEYERRRWASERTEHEKAHRRAIAELDRAEATIAKARLGRAASQLALIEEQLQRATVTAPFDGMLISGDLSRSMGAPVSRGDVLFEIAPLDDYRVALDVDERDIANVAVGQTGSLALTALPGDRLAFTVDQITSVAQTSDGRNVFKVEGRLNGAAPLLRPGMHGVAKVHAGEDRLFRVWSDGLADRIRLWLWTRAP